MRFLLKMPGLRFQGLGFGVLEFRGKSRCEPDAKKRVSGVTIFFGSGLQGLRFRFQDASSLVEFWGVPDFCVRFKFKVGRFRMLL